MADSSFYSDFIVVVKEETSRQRLAHMQYLQIVLKHKQTMYLPTLIARTTERTTTFSAALNTLLDSKWTLARGRLCKHDALIHNA